VGVEDMEKQTLNPEELKKIIDWHIANTPQVCAVCGHLPHHCNTVGGICGVQIITEGAASYCPCTSWPTANVDCSCGGRVPWLYYHGPRIHPGDPYGNGFNCSNDVPTDDPNRCQILDGKFYDGIEFPLIVEDGVVRRHWRCHKPMGHAGECDSHNRD